MDGTAALIPFSSCIAKNQSNSGYPDYSSLDEILKQPVLKQNLFPDPVIIDTLELLQDRNNFIYRIRSKEGAEGISIGHPFISKESYPMFMNLLHRRFVGKDAWNLDQLIEDSIENSVKRQGNPLCVQVATIEFAILDMLGCIAGKPVGQLIGDIHHPEISIYLGIRINEFRKKESEESFELMYGDY